MAEWRNYIDGTVGALKRFIGMHAQLAVAHFMITQPSVSVNC